MYEMKRNESGEVSPIVIHKREEVNINQEGGGLNLMGGGASRKVSVMSEYPVSVRNIQQQSSQTSLT